MKVVSKKYKGFTLIEIIVVIAILAILSTIIIISYNHFLTKSKYSKDLFNARILNHKLELYLIDNDIDVTRVVASDIRTIIGEDIEYKTLSKDHYYWFDTRDLSIVLKNISEVKEEREEQPLTWALSYKPEAICYPYLLLNDKGNKFVDLIMSFYNEDNYTNFNTIINKIETSNEKDYFYEVLDKNSFISNDGIYNYNDSKKENIIVASSVENLDSSLFNDTEFERLYFPSHVTKVIETGFINTSKLKYVSFNSYINNLLNNNFINSGVKLKDGLVINKDEYIYGSLDNLYYPFTKGDGSESNPFQVFNIKQFKSMEDYNNNYFILMNDLVIEDINIEKSFNNVFEGNNFIITGSNLFNEIGEDGVIKNVQIKFDELDLVLNNDLTYGGLTNINKGLIENVKVEGRLNVTCNNHNLTLGGIVGVNHGMITKSFNKVILDINSDEGLVNVGGITGYNDGDLLYLANDNFISVGGQNINVGGIAGYVNGGSTIQRLLNRQNVSYKESSIGSIGGIIGTVKADIELKDCAVLIYNNKYSNYNLKNAQVIGSVNNASVSVINIAYRNYTYTPLICIDSVNKYYVVKSNNLSDHLNHLNKYCENEIYIQKDSTIKFYFE